MHVVEPGRRAKPGWKKCELEKDLILDTEQLDNREAWSTNWNRLAIDALIVAAAVQFCDRTKARPSGWSRDIYLRVPVHVDHLAHWNSKAVESALHRTLRFLTCDGWQITFVPRETNALLNSHPQLEFSCKDVIIPFSDGLDSLAVVWFAEQEHKDKKLLPIRLGGRKPTTINTASVQRLEWIPAARFGERFRLIETSVRTRGFQFALFGGIAAYLSDAEEIVMPESGQGVLGPALITVGQAYADYRNHPRFTHLMEEFLYALFKRRICYSYPRLWHTKGETLKEFVDGYGPDSGWAQTRSCWRDARQASVSGKRRQCGICAACMFRRMSVHAAGCTETKDTYVWEDLSAAEFEEGAAIAFKHTEKRSHHEYAIAATLYLNDLADYLSADNQSVFERQVSRLSQDLQIPKEEVRRKLERLLKAHKEEWQSFIHSLGPQSFVARWAASGGK